MAFGAGYRWYGKRLARVFGVDAAQPTPAHTKRDGRDYVPARNWWVLFGHHFSSICGAGPIVGPVLAVAYWGWGPSILWLVVGAVFMGAVSDFSALFVSVRAGGQSIPEVAWGEISTRARLLFSAFIWLSLILVIAVFALFAAKTYIDVAEAVIPSWGLLPAALLTGWLLYRSPLPGWAGTGVGLALLALLLWAGRHFPLALPEAAGNPQTVWILILLAYAFVASVAPVQILLQPRDYLASFLLLGTIGLGVVSVFVTRPPMDPVPLHALNPESWPQAGPIWPMLFVTIACGAISGFHALVSSGTTCKQLGSEAHACRIGYGGMLLEGLVGALVLVCVAAALSRSQLLAHLKSGGPIAAFSHGFGALSAPLLGGFGVVFAVMALNAFILTTLDTATRIARYLTAELFGIRSPYLATAVSVAAAGALALTGRWARIWPAFGTSNQLVAGLALLVASCWLLRRGRPVKYTLIPALVMLATTVAAFGWQLKIALARRDPVTGAAAPDLFLAGVVVCLTALAAVVSWESWKVLKKASAGLSSR